MYSKKKTDTYISLVFRQFRKNILGKIGLCLIGVLFFISIFAPLLANDKPIFLIMRNNEKIDIYFPVFIDYQIFYGKKIKSFLEMNKEKILFKIIPPINYSPAEYSLSDILLPPSSKHWLGTDDRGRDILSRIIYGARISLVIGFVGVSIALLIGIIIGSISGYFGGKIDIGISRLIEIIMCFPTFALILTLIAFTQPSIFNIMLVIGLFGWTGIARLIRGEFLKLKNSDFVTAARALGASHLRIIFAHILPNSLAPVLVSATFAIAGAILTESSLSFLGFGVQPPTPSWGEIISQSRQYVDFAWWMTIFPGVAIFLTITGYNLLGDALRDALDPKLKN